jgi:aldehyde dehydrogenase (NAD+)
MSAIQTQVVTEALHDAGLPVGVFNIVTGRGEVVGTEITGHPDVAKISFTGPQSARQSCAPAQRR